MTELEIEEVRHHNVGQYNACSTAWVRIGGIVQGELRTIGDTWGFSASFQSKTFTADELRQIADELDRLNKPADSKETG